jgi:hypothetical protein
VVEKRANALRERWSADGARSLADVLIRVNNPFIGRRVLANPYAATQFFSHGSELSEGSRSKHSLIIQKLCVLDAPSRLLGNHAPLTKHSLVNYLFEIGAVSTKSDMSSMSTRTSLYKQMYDALSIQKASRIATTTQLHLEFAPLKTNTVGIFDAPPNG